MARSILSFYRSAIPNVSADWWTDAQRPTSGQGAVLLLPDPAEDEAMSREVARRLDAITICLDGLKHCWVAQEPQLVESRLEQFWASLD